MKSLDLEKAVMDNLERYRKGDPVELLDVVPHFERELALEMLSRHSARELMKMDNIAEVLMEDDAFVDESEYIARIEADVARLEHIYEQQKDRALEVAHDREYWATRYDNINDTDRIT